MIRKARTDVKRLAAADKAVQEGDIPSAGLIYTRLAVRRPRTETTEAAQERLTQLRALGNQKVAVIDEKLALISQNMTVSANGSQTEPKHEDVIGMFKDYATIVRQFKNIPGLKFETHVRKQSLKPEFATIVNEPVAKQLWMLGQQQEEEGSACCAFRVYEKAAQLVPAPSARSAAARLDELKKDPQVVASVTTCRELEWCHRNYSRAERLLEFKPMEARKLFKEISRRAPRDSEVYRLARIKYQ